MTAFMQSSKYVRTLAGPIGCVAADTLIITESGLQRIDAITQPTRVLSYDRSTGQCRFVLASAAYPKGRDVLYRVRGPRGELRVAGHHRVLCDDGVYRPAQELARQAVFSAPLCSDDPTKIPTSDARRSFHVDVRRWWRKRVDSSGRCELLFRRCGLRLRLAAEVVRACFQRLSGAPILAQALSAGGRSRLSQPFFRPARRSFVLREVAQLDYLDRVDGVFGRHMSESTQALQQYDWRFPSELVRQFDPVTKAYSCPTSKGNSIAVSRCDAQEVYWDIHVPGTNNYITADGLIHKNSGKSVCCAHTLMMWASLQAPNANNVRKTRFLIVRNTADQLKSTTFKTIIDWFPPEVYGRYLKTDKTLHYRLALPDQTIIDTEWMMIALDTPDDVRKALSLEATGLWGNESRELHPEVVDGLLMRVNRYPSGKDGVGVTRAGAIFDTNMPNEDTWWEDKMENPPKNWGIFIQPPAVLPVSQWVEKYREDPPENATIASNKGLKFSIDPEHDNYEFLEKTYYPNTGEGKTEDFINVYLRSMYGRALGGKPVYEETFMPERHVAEGLTPVISDQYPLCIGLDFGRTPAAVIGQTTPAGFVNVLGEICAENMGMEKFVKTKLRPYLFEHFPQCAYYIAPDPAGYQHTQLGEKSPAAWLKEQGFNLVRPATNDPEIRVQAVEGLLMAGLDSRARFQIDKVRAPLTYQGLSGKYRWKTDRHGNLMGSREPVKNKWSHPAEALQYLALVIDGGHVGRQIRRGAREVRKPMAAGWT